MAHAVCDLAHMQKTTGTVPRIAQIIIKYKILFTKDLNTFDISEIKNETTNDI